ncbi:DNA_polymerase [Hexamita inflata]|uniref:DNA-directed DNA polymerase n=1 Tax=Hexamita inflata TaxID=28002 RepID=A0AA86PCS9_9EUKA|nr:DNA polymerase [Hexamita inflata]
MKLKLHHEKLKVVTNQQAQLKNQQQKHINTIMYIQKQVRNVSAANNVIADMCVRAKDIICVQSVIKRILVNKMTQESTHIYKNEQSDLKYEQYVLIYIEHENSNLPIKWLKSISRILLIICEVEILTSLTLFRFNKINNIKQTSQLNQSSTAYLLKQLFNQELNTEHCFIYALRQTKQFTESQLDNIKSQIVKNQDLLKLENLKNIQGLGDLCVVYKKTNYKEDEEEARNSNDYTFIKNGKVVQTDKIDNYNVLIALHEQHYFIYNTAPCTTMFVKNYEAHKQYPKYFSYLDLKSIETKQSGTICYRHNATYKTKSLELIRCLFKYNLMTKCTAMTIENQDQFDQMIDAPDLNDPALSNCQEPIKKPNLKNMQQVAQYDEIMVADFETNTTTGKIIEVEVINPVSGKVEILKQLERCPHKEFLVCYCTENGKVMNGINIGSIISYIKRLYEDCKEDKRVVCYLHNLGYDASYIMFAGLKIKNVLKIGSKIACMETPIYLDNGNMVTLKFCDSYMLIPTKVSKMPELFMPGTKLVKEYFPYDYYTLTRYLKNKGNVDEALEYIRNCTREQFVNSIIKANAMIDDNTFDMKKYAIYYCEIDVEITRTCVNAFRKQIKEEFGVEMCDYLSISSITKAYQTNEGVFDDVVNIKGSLRKYLQQMIVGGRVCTKNNKKYHIKTKLQDFDAVGLYLSAMKRCYYPTGYAKTLTQDLIAHYNIKDNLFQIQEDPNSPDLRTLYVSVKLTKSKDFIPRAFPVQSYIKPKPTEPKPRLKKDEKRELTEADIGIGTRIFSNDLPDNKIIFMDHIALQDCVTFQKYNYEIISGVYYETRNYRINDIAAKMHETRQVYKKAGNPLQNIWKLAGNTGYGNLAQKDHLEEFQIVNEKQLNELLVKKWNTIEDVTSLGPDKYFVSTRKELNQQKGQQHLACMVLSTSKRIMSEVMCLAEDLGIECYYQDTDSMHIENDKIKMLSEAYKSKYNRELIGENQGQFHSDFDPEEFKKMFDKSSIVSVESIFVSKKVYIDKLEMKIIKKKVPRVDDPDLFDLVDLDESQHYIQTAYHMRMKGISDGAIKDAVDKQFNGDPMKLYEHLLNGKSVTFNMLADAVSFEIKNFVYTSRNEFTRTVQVIDDQMIIDNEHVVDSQDI